MIRIANAQLWVHDQDEALEFYTQKLGMEVRSDVTLPEMGDFRWLTVSPASQPDMHIVLMAIPGAPVFDDETAIEMNGEPQRLAIRERISDRFDRDQPSPPHRTQGRGWGGVMGDEPVRFERLERIDIVKEHKIGGCHPADQSLFGLLFEAGARL